MPFKEACFVLSKNAAFGPWRTPRNRQRFPPGCRHQPGPCRHGRQRGLPRRSTLPPPRPFHRAPPLRNRREDIPTLVLHYVQRLCARRQEKSKGVSPDFLQALTEHDWPGNVRELVNALDSAISTAQDEPILFAFHLPLHLRTQVIQKGLHTGPAPSPSDPDPSPNTLILPNPLPPLQQLRESLEGAYMERLVGLVQGDLHEACRISGLSRARVYAKLKKHGLSLGRS